MSSATPYVIHHADAQRLLAQVDVLEAMRQMFRDLASGHALYKLHKLHKLHKLRQQGQ
ncbi:hypothetical protein [Pseudomonas cavernae]|uniref:hypothetical protein n=1 Tax=Pseudomonas cavernae TaxID=2320867 RepID=UPI0013C427B2|nr:hypothetical protein [Pseudomonas cavernae]